MSFSVLPGHEHRDWAHLVPLSPQFHHNLHHYFPLGSRLHLVTQRTTSEAMQGAKSILIN